MRNSVLGMMGVAVLLAACGGGGGSGGKDAAQVPPAPKTYVAAKATVGDYYTYKNTFQALEPTPGVARESYNTRLLTSVSDDGAKSYRSSTNSPIRNGNDFLYTTLTMDFDQLGRWLATTRADCRITPAPAQYFVAPNSLSVGASWQYSGRIESKCALNPATVQTDELNAKAVAEESITVPAGTFNTIKITQSEQLRDDAFLYSMEQSCWWEPNLGVEVKCVINTTLTETGTSRKEVSVNTRELQGYANQALARKADTLLRYTGAWKGRFQGAAPNEGVAGDCKLLLKADGTITGSCSGASVTFNLTGTISANGQLSLALGGAGQFTGKLDNQEQISGTWSTPDGVNGTWSLSR